MAQLNHFSHDHSLIFHKNVDSISDDKWYFSSCNACGNMIFSSPSYICSDAKCHFILHERCVEFPEKLKHHSAHKEDHTLTLVAKAPYDAPSYMCGNCKCTAGKNFIYICEHDLFFIHLACAFPLDIRILHHSHMQHELVPLLVEVSLDCGACNNKHGGHFYMCSLICGFWLHWDCASMPTVIKLTNHEEGRHMLCLSYASFKHEDFSLPSCGICENEIKVGLGYYFCIKCRYYVHLKCVTTDKILYHRVSSLDIEKDPDIPHLPTMNEHTSVIPSLLKRFHIDETSYTNVNNGQTLFEHIHDHPLTFLHHCDENERSSLVCDACIEIISPPYYSCLVCPDFFLHSYCVHLPLKVKCPLVPGLEYHDNSHILSLIKPPMSGMIPQYFCNACVRDCSGFSYKCEKCPYFTLDAVCALLPDSITHKAHGRGHILFLEWYQFAPTKCCNNTRIHELTWTYRCRVCPDYCMHTTCSMLPMNITHKYDRHKLKLATSSEKKYDPDYHFCEVCEESIVGAKQNESDLWYYNCDECDTEFHIGCLPLVSPRLAKIKFGGTIQLLCHPCCLTSIRMLTWHSYSCGICERMLDGLKDNIAFICPKKCGYIVHYKCAKTKLRQEDNIFFLEYKESVADFRSRFSIPEVYEDI